MIIVELFKCSDDVNLVQECLINDGIVGVSGSRVFVRKLLSKATESVSDYTKKDSYSYLTYNHPDTELGYAFSSEKFSLNEAMSLVLEAYEKSEEACY